MDECNIMLSVSELKDLEDDYWACGATPIPITTVTKATAQAQLKRALGWLQRHAEENHTQVIITLDKTGWYDLCSIAGLPAKKYSHSGNKSATPGRGGLRIVLSFTRH